MKINGFISTVMLIGLLLIATLGGITHAENEEDWMPDAILHHAISEKLGIETLTIADMQRLDHLNLTGLKNKDSDQTKSKGLGFDTEVRYSAFFRDVTFCLKIVSLNILT